MRNSYLKIGALMALLGYAVHLEAQEEEEIQGDYTKVHYGDLIQIRTDTGKFLTNSSKYSHSSADPREPKWLEQDHQYTWWIVEVPSEDRNQSESDYEKYYNRVVRSGDKIRLCPLLGKYRLLSIKTNYVYRHHSFVSFSDKHISAFDNWHVVIDGDEKTIFNESDGTYKTSSTDSKPLTKDSSFRLGAAHSDYKISPWLAYKKIRKERTTTTDKPYSHDEYYESDTEDPTVGSMYTFKADEAISKIFNNGSKLTISNHFSMFLLTHRNPIENGRVILPRSSRSIKSLFSLLNRPKDGPPAHPDKDNQQYLENLTSGTSEHPIVLQGVGSSEPSYLWGDQYYPYIKKSTSSSQSVKPYGSEGPGGQFIIRRMSKRAKDGWSRYITIQSKEQEKRLQYDENNDKRFKFLNNNEGSFERWLVVPDLEKASKGMFRLLSGEADEEDDSKTFLGESNGSFKQPVQDRKDATLFKWNFPKAIENMQKEK